MGIGHAVFVALASVLMVIICVAGFSRGWVERVSTEQGLVKECKSLHHPAFFNREPDSIWSYLDGRLGSEPDTS